MTTDEQKRNWAGNVAYRAERFARPSTLDALPDLISGSEKVRVVGSRHSFNDLADTEGVQVSLADVPVDLDADIEVDAAAGTARLPAWLRYGDIARPLTERGFALPSLASLPHISVAGAVATGTHGSGDRLGSLATQVVGIELIDGRGEPRVIRRGEPDFDGAVVSLGALGIVTHLTLAVEPAYEVAQTIYRGARWDRVLENFDRVTSAGDSVSLFTTWRSTELIDQWWVKSRVGGEQRELPEIGAVPSSVQLHPIPGIDGDPCTVQLGVPGPWYDRLPHFRLEFTPSAGDEIQTEYLVAREDAPQMIASLQNLAGRIAPVLQIAEVRTVAADELWLSAASGRDVVAFHFTWHPDAAAALAVIREIEAVLPDSARAHWGKVYDRSDWLSRYPRADDFRRLRASFDPDGRFVNDYLRRLGLD
ncbi:D-arabinono-1,4-lactone oxidase [Herbiconiux sp.]|uniref:D-arabinono-1,4-lactone oxidase n=1 Tax=Herbiconiux sp. TaxID=1871186 RepID=UPI0025C21B3A|nr:D-arabinono-1,4-lactone oxidase [Herbiconiux sp.]